MEYIISIPEQPTTTIDQPYQGDILCPDGMTVVGVDELCPEVHVDEVAQNPLPVTGSELVGEGLLIATSLIATGLLAVLKTRRQARN